MIHYVVSVNYNTQPDRKDMKKSLFRCSALSAGLLIRPTWRETRHRLANRLFEEPTVVERLRARACRYLKLVTAAFQTIAEQDAAGGSLIFVGNGEGPKKDYKFDEILIKMDGGNLVLAGHESRRSRSICLVDVVGVRWWTPEDAFIPNRPTLATRRLAASAAAHFRANTETRSRPFFRGWQRLLTRNTVRARCGLSICPFVLKYLPPEKYLCPPGWYWNDGKQA